MTAIKLINKNGKIIGKDPDTGQTVPIELGSDLKVDGALEAETLLGADVLNASENQILVTQGDGSLAAETQAQGPNPYDQAQTFGESDVVVTTTQTEVANGSVKLITNSFDGTTVSRPSDNDSFGRTERRGVGINPNANLGGVRVTISGNTSGASLVELEEADGTQLDTASVSSAGDTAELIASLSSGTKYYIYVSDGGNSYTQGNYTEVDFPYTSADVDMPVAVRGSGSEVLNNVYNISDVTALFRPAKSGNALIEWDRGIPTDIFEWDVATFTESPDGETVDVFVAYSSDGGSTWTRTNSGNPITRNYSLNEDTNITPDVDVRIETELSRSDTTNNPTLDSVYRSWLV